MSTDDVRPSPLDAEHRALCASMTPFAGRSMPLRYASELAEHTAGGSMWRAQAGSML